MASRAQVLLPRAAVHDGRMVIRYAVGVELLWCLLAVAGIGFGFVALSADNTEGGYIGLGLGIIGTFVAWFAVRPVVVADRTGVAVLPLFGSRTVLRWSEVRAVSVRSVRAARGRGQALVIEAADDEEVRVDGLWMGLTSGALDQVERDLGAFADQIGLIRPATWTDATDPVEDA